MRARQSSSSCRLWKRRELKGGRQQRAAGGRVGTRRHLSSAPTGQCRSTCEKTSTYGRGQTTSHNRARRQANKQVQLVLRLCALATDPFSRTSQNTVSIHPMVLKSSLLKLFRRLKILFFYSSFPLSPLSSPGLAIFQLSQARSALKIAIHR